jgi:hypothetical protein
MKITNIDGIDIVVEHCNGYTLCPHFSGTSSWCFHPIFDKGNARQGESVRASFMMDNPIPEGCPLPDKQLSVEDCKEMEKEFFNKEEK